jgi:hypothetical protein
VDFDGVTKTGTRSVLEIHDQWLINRAQHRRRPSTLLMSLQGCDNDCDHDERECDECMTEHNKY